jgi:hypothetical protein
VGITLRRAGRLIGAVAVMLLGGCSSLIGSKPPATAPSGAVSSGPTTASTGLTGLTEFGALVSDWNAHHHPDPKAVGVAYNPGLVTYASGPVDQFVDVATFDSGRVIQLSLQLPRRTPVATARAAALGEMPHDAKIVWQQTTGRCLQEL